MNRARLVRTRIQTVVLDVKIPHHCYNDLIKIITKVDGWHYSQQYYEYTKSGVTVQIFHIRQKKYHGVSIRYTVTGEKNIIKRLNRVLKKSSNGYLRPDEYKIHAMQFISELPFGNAEQAVAFVDMIHHSKAPKHTKHTPFGFACKNTSISFQADGNAAVMTVTVKKKAAEKLTNDGKITEKQLQKHVEKMTRQLLKGMIGTNCVYGVSDVKRKIGKSSCTQKAAQSLRRFADIASQAGVDAAFDDADEQHECIPTDCLTLHSIKHYFGKMETGLTVVPDEVAKAFGGSLDITEFFKNV